MILAANYYDHVYPVDAEIRPCILLIQSYILSVRVPSLWSLDLHDE